MRHTPLFVLTLALGAVIALIGSTAAAACNGPAPASTAPPATHSVVKRLVDRAGHLAPGATYRSESRTVDCGSKSPVAVNPGIRWCGSTADYLPACYRSAAHRYALCVRNPFGHEVIRVRASFPTPFPADHPAVPLGLLLDNGTGCHLRIGGAGTRLQQHPSWIPYYDCSDHQVVFASPHRRDTAGINETHASWTVPVGPAPGTRGAFTHHVLRAYFVGFAA